MSLDITDILKEWPYDPSSNIRRIQGDDGAAKIQIRVQEGGFSGVLQMNLDGRPDGRKPYGCDFALEYYMDLLEEHLQEGKKEKTFKLSHTSCVELFREAYSIYGRYVFLLQIGEYEQVVEDTRRNISLFSFIKKYARKPEDRANLEKWRPYILRINATARAMLSLKDGKYNEALEIIEDARLDIESLPEMEAREFQLERDRSRVAFDDLEKLVKKNKPLSDEEKLENELDRLIQKEAYERAAIVRDQINQIRGINPHPAEELDKYEPPSQM